MRLRKPHAVPSALPSISALHSISALLALALLLALAPAPAPALAAQRTLSDLGPTDGLVSGAVIAAGRVVYRADYEVEGQMDLYSAPLAGGAPARLSAGLPAGQVIKFEVGAGRAVFSYEIASGRQLALYSAPIAGGPALRLNPEYSQEGAGRADIDFALAGPYAVYGVDQERADVYQLFTVNAAGGAPIQLSPDLPDLAGTFPWKVRAVQTSDDGSDVAFTMEAQGADPRLYVAPVDGSAAATLASAGAPLLNAGATNFALSPDGSRVLYRSLVDGSADLRLISVAADGSGEQELTTAGQISFQFTPDGARAVYVSGDAGAEKGPLRSVPVGGGAPADIAADVAFAPAAFIPSSADLIFRPFAGGLARAPVAGGAAQVVLAGGFASPANIRFTADGSRGLFMAAADGGAQRLYSYAVAGGGPAAAIDDPALSTAFLGDFRLAGGRAVYQAQASGGPPRLYSVPVAGGASALIGEASGPGEDRLAFLAASDTQVVFATGRRASPFGQLFFPRLLRAPADGSAAPALVDSSRAIVGDVGFFEVSPADGRVVYIADQEVDGRAEIFSVPPEGGEPLRLAGPGAADDRLVKVALKPAGGRIAYAIDQGGQTRLYSVPVAGGAASEITGLGAGIVEELALGPGGAQVFVLLKPDFLATESTLYRAPAAGGAAAEVDSGVVRFQVSPDGARIVYVKSGFPPTLRSAPAAGGAPVILGAVSTFAPVLFSPDGGRVVYRSSDPFGGSGPLVSQPSAGGEAAPLFTPGAEESLAGYAISPDGAAVAFVVNVGSGFPDPADASLRRVPIAGGESTPLASVDGGGIEFAFAPAGGRVVYRTTRQNQGGSLTYSFFSVPAAGGASAALYGPATSDTTVAPFAISSDGAWVAFTVDYVLYSAPVGGGSAAVRLSPQGAPVVSLLGQMADAERPFALTDDGRAVFYTGGRLYAASLLGGEATPFSEPLPRGGVERFAIAGDDVVFLGARDVVDPALGADGVRELYAANLPALAPAAPGFSAASLGASESAAPLQILVTLGAPQGRALTVGYRVTGGSARAGVDYALGAGPLSFGPGETSKSIPLTLIDRPGYQGQRTIELTLDDPELAGLELAATTLTVTISDDEYGLFLPQLRR